MLLSVKRRFLFVSNTKTASTSIEAALRDFCEIERTGSPQRKHIEYRQILKEYRFLFSRKRFAPETFFRFAVMRDPVDWFYSWYRYRRGNDVEAPLPEDMTLQDFWELNDWNRTRGDGSRNLQSHMMLGPQGGIGLDMILRYEDLETGFPRLAKGLGIKADIPRLNVSRLKGGSDEIDPGLRREMELHFAPDYEVYGSLERINASGAEKLAARAG